MLGQLEALLFAAGEPLSDDKISSVMGLTLEEVRNILTKLNRVNLSLLQIWYLF